MQSGTGVAERPSLVSRLRSYSAAVIATAGITAGIIAVADRSYTGFIESQLGRDALSLIKNVVANRFPAAPTFRLDVSGEHFADNPNAMSIAAAVEHVKTLADNKFLVLDRSDREFIQAATKDNKEWELEYRAGQMEKPKMKPLLFGCDKPVSAETVIKALQLYSIDNIAWTELCTWSRVIL
jgi:hypothetical protein